MLKKWKKGTPIKIGNSGCKLAGFDNFNSEILTELKRVQYKISKIWSKDWN